MTKMKNPAVGKIEQLTVNSDPQKLIEYAFPIERVRREKPTLQSDFISTFNQLQSQANQTAKDKGWWDKPREDGTLIALMHAELSEALEWLRQSNPPSDHIPGFSGAEEELADIVIRLMDMAARHNWNVAEAIVSKMEFNQGRAYKHGGKAF